jgi:IS30 family transposase
MSHYKHLTTEERENAMVMLAEGFSIRAIALILKRATSTISREIKRNSKCDGSYRASHAERQYKKRRERCGPKHIMINAETNQYVKERILLKWTPEQIAGRAKLEGFPVRFSYATIYRAIDRNILPRSLKKEMRFKSKYKKHKTDDKRGKLQDITSIHDRPSSVEKRLQIGHWESDTVLGQRKTGAIGTHVERKTGFLVAFKLDTGTSEEFNASTIRAFASLPKKCCKSLTVDRGKEFTLHSKLATDMNLKVFFCDPYSPWQRGTNENTNGLLRQFFPKKTSFSLVSPKVLDEVVALINNRPRKRLNWKTPAEVFFNSQRQRCT